MDEPTEGLAPIIISQIGEIILSIKSQGTTVLLAEQNLQLALSVADRHYIIDNGQIRFNGTRSELDDNEEIKRTYLGVGINHRAK
jgi:branched-chain amino acid transport system ATP-binding protein